MKKSYLLNNFSFLFLSVNYTDIVYDTKIWFLLIITDQLKKKN